MMCLLSFVCCLLFFKQKTAYEMRISDWSSDVCSSDLGVEDLPLMPGLAEIADAATVFDAPQGRIVESYAAGTVAAAEIRSFYAQTLPQLGWTAVDAGQAGPLEFRREGRSEEHTSEPVTNAHIVCRLLLEKKKNKKTNT